MPAAGLNTMCTASGGAPAAGPELQAHASAGLKSRIVAAPSRPKVATDAGGSSKSAGTRSPDLVPAGLQLPGAPSGESGTHQAGKAGAVVGTASAVWGVV